MRTTAWTGVAAVLAAALALSPGQARAQGTETSVAVGIAIPVYEAAEVHSVGPHLQAYAGTRMSERLQLRAGLGFTLLTGRKRDPSQGSTRDPLPVVSVDGSMVFSPSGNGRGFYGMAGAGAYALFRSGAGGDAMAFAPGISLGAGLNFSRADLPLFVQVRAEVPFSSIGTDTDFSPTVYLPISVGIRFP